MVNYRHSLQQFHTSVDPQIADSKVVCLEEMTKLDPSINDLFNLSYGEYAWRATKDDEWQREPFED